MEAQIAPDTPVEAYENGNVSALTTQQQRGRALFRGKARCIACHHGPSYTDSIAHNTGASDAGQLGVVQQTGRIRDLGAFKTPTLRGVGGSIDTAPFFHDGFAGSLTEVVNFYNAGGGSSGSNPIQPARAVLGSADVEIRPLRLTVDEMLDLIAFLEKLGS